MEITENIEEYLELLWNLTEEGSRDIAKINQVAEGLDIAPPSAVEMLKKMTALGLVNYLPREGVTLTGKGREKARQVVRNHRLAELLLTDILGMGLDRDVHSHACGLEHHISEEVAEAVCTRLSHPKRCPHGKPIPEGNCCRV
jgi:DtxR family Mn-dependent transcriptional regulator